MVNPAETADKPEKKVVNPLVGLRMSEMDLEHIQILAELETQIAGAAVSVQDVIRLAVDCLMESNPVTEMQRSAFREKRKSGLRPSGLVKPGRRASLESQRRWRESNCPAESRDIFDALDAAA